MDARGASDPVRIGDSPLTVADVVRVADGSPVQLTDAAIARMTAAREVVQTLVDGDELIYGLNTGLGHMRDVRVPTDSLRLYQEGILLSHNGGLGEPLPSRVVRAAMAVRVAGLATGGAGASVAAAEALVAMLGRGVHPIVPTVGSVGASDLMHMAAIAMVATGLGGRAELDGEVLAGPDAMRRAGIAPFVMGPKDGLALVSANAVSVGWASLVVDRAGATAAAADLAVAASLEATGGNPSIVDPIVIAAKPVPGQAVSAAAIRGLLAGSDLFVPAGRRSVQDPLSFRVAPQVHGAFREFIRFLAEAVEVELAASDDNPYVSVAERRLISNGNFHPMVLALAADAVRPAAAHVGLLSDRRLSHLWTTIFDVFAETENDDVRRTAGPGGLFLRYAGAARYAELRAMAGPVTLDVPPLDQGVEDHATNAPYAVAHTADALDRVEDILVIELLLACDTIRNRSASGRLGSGVAAGLDELVAVLAGLGDGATSDTVHAGLREALHERILPAATAGVG
jgi:histidine ammonia-lyase